MTECSTELSKYPDWVLGDTYDLDVELTVENAQGVAVPDPLAGCDLQLALYPADYQEQSGVAPIKQVTVTVPAGSMADQGIGSLHLDAAFTSAAGEYQLRFRRIRPGAVPDVFTFHRQAIRISP